MPSVTRQQTLTARALSFPRDLSDRCVKCGLCLPHCPTYGLHQDEGDSPRGRIALLQALDEGRLQATPALRAHIDGCLDCRRCEAVCPADVPYGQILDAGRVLLDNAGAATTLPAWVAALAAKPFRILVHVLLWLGQCMGLRWLVRRLPLPGRWQRLTRYWPVLERPRRLRPSASNGRTKGKLKLFTGCVGRMAGQAALQDSLALLAAMGYAVDIPRQQGCCGALHLHNGAAAKAAVYARRNLDCFADAANVPVLGCDSGCVATLREYPTSFTGQTDGKLPPVMDVCAFVQQNWPAGLELRPLPAKLLLHIPCTQRNVLRNEAAITGLLQRIPGLEVVALRTTGCCGAAGSYWLTQPQAADRLVQPIVAEAAALAPQYLASSNTGCAMHLAAHLPRRIAVIHPISLIHRQLPA